MVDFVNKRTFEGLVRLSYGEIHSRILHEQHYKFINAHLNMFTTRPKDTLHTEHPLRLHIIQQLSLEVFWKFAIIRALQTFTDVCMMAG